MEDPTFRSAVDRHPELLIDLILQLCRGLGHLHSRDFYHCDIAPKNIFLRGRLPEAELIIGDLGVGRTLPQELGDTADTTIFLAGTRAYSPSEVVERMNTDITLAELRRFQPHWDIYAAAKTSMELIQQLGGTPDRRPAWLDALTVTLSDAMAGKRFTTTDELAKRVHLLHPAQYTIFEVKELIENERDSKNWLLPIGGVTTSQRIRALTYHPALLRLKHVPQLMMMSKVYHSGNHTRYEHSLGTYQNARHYLLALLNDDSFLSYFSPELVELALIAALLSNVTRFPLSIVVHEIHSSDRSLFPEFSRREMYSLVNKQYAAPSLEEAISDVFPGLNLLQLAELLTSGPSSRPDPAIRFIHFLLNSSIDARVIDYLRRDSLHLGISKGDPLDLSDLLPHIAFRNGQLVIRSTGLTEVEHIIALRYWLYNRVYWNRPNRTLFAMLKFVLWSLHRRVPSFPSHLRERVLASTEEELLNFLCTEAKEACLTDVAEPCSFLLGERPTLYKELLQFNRAEGDAMAETLCENFARLDINAQMSLQEQLNQWLVAEYCLPAERVHILFDLPLESGRPKLGEDINVIGYGGDPRPLVKLSGIVDGVRKGVRDHLQRLRVFIHPETQDQLVRTSPNGKLESEVRYFMESLA